MTVYIVGAGLAGLAAAVALVREGTAVELLESAPQAGGRCRSWFDHQFADVIDNGNHLVLSGNRATFDYLRTIGAEKRLIGPERARYAFFDACSRRHWTIMPNEGPLPWWVFSRRRRVPDTSPRDYMRFAPLFFGRRLHRICDVVACKGALWDRLMRPLLLAALNTEPECASAQLAAAVLRETLARGGNACLPRVAFPSLAATFVEPALAYIGRLGGMFRPGVRVRAVQFQAGAASALELGDSRIALSNADRVILAVPPWTAGAWVPELTVPDRYSAIVNAHYRVAAGPGAPGMIGLVGGTAEWLFAFPGRISATVSAADAIVDRDRSELAALLWRDVAAAYALADPLPPWQIVKEKRATFRATPDQALKRPPAVTRWTNLHLAGDWTATGLPATIEGAIRSGQTAARIAAAAR